VHAEFWRGNLWEPLGRPGHRWEDNTKIYIQEVGWQAWSRLIWLSTETGGMLL